MNTSPWSRAGYNWYSGLQGPTEEAIIRLKIASMNLFDTRLEAPYLVPLPSNQLIDNMISFYINLYLKL